MVHDLYGAGFLDDAGRVSISTLLAALVAQRLSESAHVAVYAPAGPLVEAGVHSHVHHGVPVVFALRFAHDLPGDHIINVGGSVLTPRHQVLVAVAHREPHAYAAILVTPRELFHWVRRTQVPQFDRVVRRRSQERIQTVGIAVGTLIKLDCVRVPLVCVIHRANGFVHISVKYDDFFVCPGQDPNLARSSRIVQREGADGVGRPRMLKRLKQLVKAFLLKALDIVTVRTTGQLVLVVKKFRACS